MPFFQIPQQEMSKIVNAVKGVAGQVADAAQNATNQAVFQAHTGEMLKNGGAGMCVPTVALQQADVLVTTSHQSVVSAGIKLGSLSSVSHAALYIGQNFIIDAMGGTGVQERPVQALINSSSAVVAFRHRGMTQSVGQQIVEIARGLVKEKRPYDTAGALLGGGMSQIIGQKASVMQSDSGFYCSELVAHAYVEAGLPIAGVGAEANTPGDLPASADLVYVGHVKYADVFK